MQNLNARIPVKCDRIAKERIESVLGEKKIGIFNQFRDMINLDDEVCQKVTGWTKKQFILFSKYINSVNDSAGRTLEELIALYRFWLINGCNQKTIAFTKTNSSQQEISHYLAQIRKSIYSDFVPHFLGSDKPREFYVNHNNESVRALFNLKRNQLVLIADGTYLQCEKSRNNDFQYLTYSGQKNSH